MRSDSAESLAKEALSPQLRISGQYLGVSLSEFQASRVVDSVPRHSEQDELFMSATSIESLKRSWRVVLARDARDGELRHQTEQIAGHLDEVLAELSRSLRDGTFRPAPLAQVRLPKKEEGDYRTLDIPSVRDRIVERALVDALGHRVDQAMSPCSYGYRLGLGVDDAIDHLTGLRDLGMVHVLRTDVEDFFPHVRLDSVLNILGNLLPSRRLLALVALLVVPRRTWRASTIRPGGVAQGSALSPMLANLAFTAVDEAMTRTGIGYVRFADDIVVCADTRARLLEARDLLTSHAAAHGFTLNKDKTMLTGFDEGFCYLGEDLGSTYPVHDPHHDIDHDANPDRVVYVGRDGARVSVTRDRLVVDSERSIPYLSIPRNAVRRIVLTGAVGLSAGARSWALFNDVDVVLLSRRGTYLGQLSGKRSDLAAQRLIAQCDAARDETRRMPLARIIVASKMRNQLRLLQRTARRAHEESLTDTLDAIREGLQEVPRAQSLDELMGLEGAASAAYFAALGGLVPQEVSFPGRSRRPPRDVANAALSYGYALLLGECTAALYAAGLEPSLGILHASTDRRPSLALDLMEEFRPLLVDRAVLGLLRTKRLRAEHGGPAPDTVAQEHPDGVWLTSEGRKVLVDGYEAALQRTTGGALPGFSGTWRRHIHHQAQRLASALFNPDYEWTGTSWR
ncbi:CRISPR-associated endonuclease Cas1 [Actinomyces bowdenii]|uniref:CRISPR-associated endonuclease Cas1 n=1 Tax=Actinomyces bowdenii TaxID=131109 RepID=UPI001ABC3332|nr:CRISPR-associated endonuclease Cas1 [Actinomyces bowdenii]